MSQEGISWNGPQTHTGLSPIENLWALMEQQLGDREGINNTNDLQLADGTQLHSRSCMTGLLNDRMKLAVKLQGGSEQGSEQCLCY